VGHQRMVSDIPIEMVHVTKHRPSYLMGKRHDSHRYALSSFCSESHQNYFINNLIYYNQIHIPLLQYVKICAVNLLKAAPVSPPFKTLLE
jgi:hypothetical protein